MKSLLYVIGILFVLGFVCKFLHYPGGSLLMLSTMMLTFVYSVLSIIKLQEKRIELIALYLGMFFWVAYIVFRVQFWDNAIVLFVLAGLCSLCFSVIVILKKIPQQKLYTLFLVFSILGFLFTSVPSDKLYYAINLNELFNKEFNSVNYRSWDKYSWFLYHNGNYEEALISNAKAQSAIKNVLSSNMQDYNFNYLEEYSAVLLQNEINIKMRNWTVYNPPIERY